MRGLLYRLLYRQGFAAYLFLAAFIMFSAVTASSLISINRNKKAAENLVHTYEILVASERFKATLNSAEAASRSYRLVQMRAYKGAYLKQREATYDNYRIIVLLTEDNQSQVTRLKRLKHLLDRRIERMDTLTSRRAFVKEPDSTKLYFSTEIMERINVLLKEIQTEENRLLEFRNSAFDQSLSNSAVLEVVGLLFGLLVFGLSYLGLSHQSKELRSMLGTTNKLNAELQRSRSRLEMEVERQTRQLRDANQKLSSALQHLDTNYRREKEDLDRKSRELEDARRFQESMLPRLNFPADLWEIGAIMKTAMEVGGDYYDFVWNQEEGEIKVALGDAAGHGLLAAMIVSTVRSYFQANASMLESPALLKLISDGLYGFNMRNALMGLAIMRIRNHDLEITSAGMPPILIWRHSERRIEEVTIKSIFLGSSFDVEYEPHRLQLQPDDVILACSDGVIEARHSDGDTPGELFGMERLGTILRTMAEEPAQIIVSEIFAAVNEWIGNKSPADDISLIAIRVK